MRGRGGSLWLFGGHGNQRADGPIVFRQVLAGDTLNIFGRHRSDSFDKLIDFPPSGTDGFSLSEQHGMPEVGILLEDMRGFDLVLGPLEFLLCRRIGLEAFDLSMEGVLDHLRFLARAHEGIEVEKARIGLQQAVFCSDGQAMTFVRRRGSGTSANFSRATESNPECRAHTNLRW